MVTLVCWGCIHRHVPHDDYYLVLDAAEGGRIHVLQWLKENGLIELDDAVPWFEAAEEGHVHILEWGFTNSKDAFFCAARGGQTDARLWARNHGLVWDSRTCALAADGGHLDALQWLRENGCPWDWRTIHYAQQSDHLDIVQWARDNGCPEPVGMDDMM